MRYDFVCVGEYGAIFGGSLPRQGIYEVRLSGLSVAVYILRFEVVVFVVL